MVSLKDVASACGVSVATVSKALNNHKDIGDETKARIRKTAKELGYVPNAAAKSMKTNRTHNIGVLFVDEALSGLTHDYFSNVLDSFKRAVEKVGYDITFISNDRSRPGRSSYLEHAIYRAFDGVVIACVQFDDPEVIELVKSDIPVVTIDHIYDNNASVLSDNVSGMRDLVEHMIDQGPKKIAYIHGQNTHDSAVTSTRLTTYYQVMEEHGLEVPDEYLREAEYRSTTKAYENTLKLLDLKNPPTCILYSDDFACYGGIRAVTERGLKVPDDISIAGYDGIRVGRHIRPRLTTLRQDTEAIGRIAAQNLIDLIEKPKTTLKTQVYVKGKLYEGDTVRPLN